MRTTRTRRATAPATSTGGQPVAVAEVVRAEVDHDEVERRVRVQAGQEVREAVAAVGHRAVEGRGAAVQSFGDHLEPGAERGREPGSASERRAGTGHRPIAGSKPHVFESP